MTAEPTFGDRLRRLRSERSLSQSQLEAASGIPKTRLSRYENGHSLPSVHSLRRLAAALETTEAALLDDRTEAEERLIRELRARGIGPATDDEAVSMADRLEPRRGRQTG